MRTAEGMYLPGGGLVLHLRGAAVRQVGADLVHVCGQVVAPGASHACERGFLSNWGGHGISMGDDGMHVQSPAPVEDSLQRKARMLARVLERPTEAPGWMRRRARWCRWWHGRWRGAVDWSGDRPRVECSRCRVWWVW